MEQVESGKAELWTSTFTLAEVWKRKCEGVPSSLPQSDDKLFEDFVEREFVRKVQVTVDVGNLARRLLRQYSALGKPQDAIHVASCLLNNIDEMHTFDSSNLLRFDGQIPRIDQVMLKICVPPRDTNNNQTGFFHDDENTA